MSLVAEEAATMLVWLGFARTRKSEGSVESGCAEGSRLSSKRPLDTEEAIRDRSSENVTWRASMFGRCSCFISGQGCETTGRRD